MGEQDRGFHAERIQVSYWDELGNETVRNFAANLPEDEIPETIDSPSTGLPAGRDRAHHRKAYVLRTIRAGCSPPSGSVKHSDARASPSVR